MSGAAEPAGASGINGADPRVARTPWYSAQVLALLNDPRDAQFVGLIAECLLYAAAGIGLFFSGKWLWYLAPVYWAVLLFGFIDRFTLMLHCTSHRPLFKAKYRALGHVIPWVIGPFFGQTPGTYFAHHMGMHHVEENLVDDLSSTVTFQRDSFAGWLRYWGRFMTVGLLDLAQYMAKNNRQRLLRKVFVGEGVYWSVVAVLAYFAPGATAAVFIIPLALIRTLMMMGNWGQHAFVDQAQPENPYLSSITCINSRYNRRAFNDGYHIGHHLKAKAHWTEYPVEFEANVAEYARQDAIVFEGLDFFLVWLLLMTKRWSVLAKAFVRLPGAPARTDAEAIALMQSRMRPLMASDVQPTLAVQTSGK
ncbi:MAG TPA: fatty acid desaturase [Polyangiaceae bacterium]|jgi:fatty acid desaturase|nr:fatty acid desaturase [Polyangiaceae bacterium]